MEQGRVDKSLDDILDQGDVVALLDGIPGVYEQVQLGLKQAKEDLTVSLDELEVTRERQ